MIDPKEPVYMQVISNTTCILCDQYVENAVLVANEHVGLSYAEPHCKDCFWNAITEDD